MNDHTVKILGTITTDGSTSYYEDNSSVVNEKPQYRLLCKNASAPVATVQHFDHVSVLEHCMNDLYQEGYELVESSAPSDILIFKLRNYA